MQSVTEQEGKAARDALFRETLDEVGVSRLYLARKLKAELNYRQPLILKTTEEIPGEDGKEATKIPTEKEVKVITPKAMEIRQKARMDAHKLRGDYPAEQIKVGGNGTPITLDKIQVEFVSPKKPDAD